MEAAYITQAIQGASDGSESPPSIFILSDNGKMVNSSAA